MLPLFLSALQAQGKVSDAYDICSTILIELGETMPESFHFNVISSMITETLNMYEEVDADEWLKSEEMVDKKLGFIFQFYSAIALASYFCRSFYVVVFFVCRAVQLSLRKGICEYTPTSLIQFASLIIKDENALLC